MNKVDIFIGDLNKWKFIQFIKLWIKVYKIIKEQLESREQIYVWQNKYFTDELSLTHILMPPPPHTHSKVLILIHRHILAVWGITANYIRYFPLNSVLENMHSKLWLQLSPFTSSNSLNMSSNFLSHSLWITTKCFLYINRWDSLKMTYP